jgi:hypothetical protein
VLDCLAVDVSAMTLAPLPTFAAGKRFNVNEYSASFCFLTTVFNFYYFNWTKLRDGANFIKTLFIGRKDL